MILLPDGKILVSSEFGYTNNVYLLYANGALDGSFQVGIGPNDTISAMILQ